jgi:hypothetical protein
VHFSAFWSWNRTPNCFLFVSLSLLESSKAARFCRHKKYAMHESLFLQLILFALCQSLMEIIQTEDRRGSGGITPGRFLKYCMLTGYSAFGVG